MRDKLLCRPLQIDRNQQNRILYFLFLIPLATAVFLPIYNHYTLIQSKEEEKYVYFFIIYKSNLSSSITCLTSSFFSLLLPFLEVILQTVIDTLKSKEDQTIIVKAFDNAFVRKTGGITNSFVPSSIQLYIYLYYQF